MSTGNMPGVKAWELPLSGGMYRVIPYDKSALEVSHIMRYTNRYILYYFFYICIVWLRVLD